MKTAATQVIEIISLKLFEYLEHIVMNDGMYVVPPEIISAIYSINFPVSNTNSTASVTKPLLLYSQPHLPMMHTVLSGKALTTAAPLSFVLVHSGSVKVEFALLFHLLNHKYLHFFPHLYQILSS
jgi:hypothetical protein